MIARCADVAAVITAVNFGRDNELLIAIRGGGHNGPGLGSCDDGLVIDLSMMKGVRVDPATRTVRVVAGCTQGDVDHATHPFGPPTSPVRVEQETYFLTVLSVGQPVARSQLNELGNR